MRLVDLSQPFDPRLYARAGRAPELELRAAKTVEADGVSSFDIRLSSHIGTHIDAPSHLVRGGPAIDALPLDTFHGSAVVLDLPRGPNGAVDAADLEPARPPIEEGDIVLIRTGWSERLTEPEYASHHPYLTTAAAEWLVARRVRMVGMDVQSVDLPHSLRTPGFRYTSLRTLLEGGVPVALNLRGLDAVARRRVAVFALPIPLTGADAAPVRVVALLD